MGKTEMVLYAGGSAGSIGLATLFANLAGDRRGNSESVLSTITGWKEKPAFKMYNENSHEAAERIESTYVKDLNSEADWYDIASNGSLALAAVFFVLALRARYR